MLAYINKGDSYALLLLRYYERWQDRPHAQDFVQTIINKYPLKYFKSLYDKYVPNLGAPSAGTLLPLAQEKKTASAVFRNYRFFKQLPESENIIDTAIPHTPTSTLLRFIWDVNNYSTQDEKIPAQKAISYLYAHHRDALKKDLKDEFALVFFYKYLIAAQQRPDIRDFVIDTVITGNKAAALSVLANRQNAKTIKTLSSSGLDKLLQAAKIQLTNDKSCHVFNGRAEGFVYIDALKKGSWLMEHGGLNQEEKATILGCALKTDTIYALGTLKRNTSLTFNSGIIKAAVLQRPLYFLSGALKDQKISDIHLAGNAIPYKEVMAAAQKHVTDAETLDRGEISTTIDIVNNLHEYDSATRFALLEGLSPKNRLRLAAYQDDGHYYTSSFNQIIDNAIKVLETNPEARKWLFDKAQDNDRDQDYISARYGQKTPVYLKTLTTNAMHYGRLDDFLSVLNEREIAQISDLIFKSFENRDNSYSAQSNAAIAATTVLQIMQHMAAAGHSATVEKAILSGYAGAKDSDTQNALGSVAALYAQDNKISAKNSVFFDIAQKHYSPILQNYMRDTLKTTDLFDNQGRNFQMMVFYGDEDGHNSYAHFKALYQRDKSWHYENHKEYISFSRNGITLFANKPQFKDSGNKAIEQRVEELGGKISVLVHRGHSYHVEHTANQYLNKDIKFFWLGSCRSSRIWHYIGEAPNMQFIYSQNVGTMLVNDPLLKHINDTLAQGRDLDWKNMRDAAFRMAHGDKRAKNYVFPDGSLEYGLRMGLAFLDNARTESAAARKDLNNAENIISRAQDNALLSIDRAQQQPFQPL